MPDLSRTRPLDRLPGEGVAGPEPVTFEIPPFCPKLVLRGEEAVASRAGEVLGFPLPRLLEMGEGAAARALRLGPDAWLLVLRTGEAGELAARLRQALEGSHHAVVEASERFEGLAVSGARAREVLNAGCALDLHPSAFPPRRTARTLLGKATVVLARPEADDRFELFVERSFAPYLWLFLTNAAREFGYRVRRLDG